MSTQLNLQSVSSINVASGSVNVNLTWTISAPLDNHQVTTLAAGFTAVAVPTGATLCVIVPPAGNTVAITLKGLTGDTGVPLHLTNPTVISLATGATFGILLGAGGIAGIGFVFL